MSVRTDSHLWSETYERELEDIFAIQDEISGRIVQALKVTLGGGEQEAMTNGKKPTRNLEAYELYLRGRYFWQRRSEDDIRRAIGLFEQATGLDPQFARAWSSLAAAHITLTAYSDAPKLEHFSQAVSFAQKALALDESLAEAHAVLGDMARSNKKWVEAEKQYLLAIANETKNSTAHLWYGEHLLAVGLAREIEEPRSAVFILAIESMRDAEKRLLFLELLKEQEARLPRSVLWSGNVRVGRIDDAFRLTNLALDSAITPINTWWKIWLFDMVQFRQDPRFAEFVTNLGLVDNWREYGWPDACQPAGDGMICE